MRRRSLIQGASADPARSGAILKSRRTEVMGVKESVDVLGKAIKPCEQKSGEDSAKKESEAKPKQR